MTSAFDLATRLWQITAIEQPPTEGGALTADEARTAILAMDLGWASYSREHRTWADAYRAVYGEPLQTRERTREQGRRKKA